MPIFFSTSKQRGAAIIENTIAMLVFLLLALATYESAHWLLLRQALNTALLDSARIGATQHAHPQIIHEAFSVAFKNWPAFAFNSDPAYWSIEQKQLAPVATDQQIQHNYQALQYLAGNHTVFAANTLHLRLHYLHQPSSAMIRQAIRLAAVLSKNSLYYTAYQKGLVPIVTDVQVSMQSDHQIKQPTAQPVPFKALGIPNHNPTNTIASTPSEPPLNPHAPWLPSFTADTPKPWLPTEPIVNLLEMDCTTTQCCQPPLWAEQT